MFFSSRRPAPVAAEANIPCVPHSANPAMVTVFTLHTLGAIPNAGPLTQQIENIGNGQIWAFIFLLFPYNVAVNTA
jgi:hypothetical protein